MPKQGISEGIFSFAAMILKKRYMDIFEKLV
jgi:hypothetical protein